MKIDRKLNLVIPVVRDDVTVFVHSTPIGRDVFEQYHGVLAKSFSIITEDGINVIAALATSKLALKDAAEAKGIWPAVERNLIGEIRRLSNVVSPSDGGGWKTSPLEMAIRENSLDGDEMQEVENTLVFFTLISLLFRKAQLPMMLTALEQVGGLRTTSLNCTEWKDSLMMLIDQQTSEKET
jgi:hypothetical protein